jgi:hypothetical protein
MEKMNPTRVIINGFKRFIPLTIHRELSSIKGEEKTDQNSIAMEMYPMGAFSKPR